MQMLAWNDIYQLTYLKVLTETLKTTHCVKSVRIRNFSGPYIHALWLNTVDISPYLIRMWENKDQKNSEYEHFPQWQLRQLPM